MKDLKALIIEDSPQDADLIRLELRRAGYSFISKRVDTAQGVSNELHNSNWDIILSDYNLPGFNALDALQILKESKRDIPFILISGAVGEQTAVDLMKAGACDFLKKDDLSRLGPIIEREIREAQNRVEKLEANARFRHLTEAMPQLVWIAKSDASVQFYNQRWFKYTGLSPASAGPNDWQKIVHPEDILPMLNRWHEAVAKFKPFEIEFRLKRHDGAYLWHLMRSIPVLNENKEIVEWFGTSTDIEQQKQAILLRDEFLSIASHELRTPITSLKLRLAMTRKGVNPQQNLGPSIEKIAQILDSSLAQVERLVVLVEDLLDVSRIQLGKLRFRTEPVDLSELIQDVLERHREQLQFAKCSLSLALEPHLVGLWDRSRMEQIIVNLITNAVKYAPGSAIDVTLNKEGHLAILKVKDQGPGILKERQSKIFERFERATSARNISGLGLGLYIVDQIVKGHGGSIQVESQLGKGSTFIVKLPMESASISLINKDLNFKVSTG